MTATILDTPRVQASHLDSDATSRLRAALASARAAQKALVARHAAAVTELTGHGDVDSILEREIASAASARVGDTIDDIDDALARLDSGTYGACESCRAAIPLERLEAIPHARFCVACSGPRSSVLR